MKSFSFFYFIWQQKIAWIKGLFYQNLVRRLKRGLMIIFKNMSYYFSRQFRDGNPFGRSKYGFPANHNVKNLEGLFAGFERWYVFYTF